jgi:hypothetical protein
MRKIVYFLFFFITGCFLVFTHESKTPSIITVHLLPPKVSEKLKPKKPIDAYIGVAPFSFELKFSENKEPFYFDYSYLPNELFLNMSVLLENGIFTKVYEIDLKDKEVTPNSLIQKISESKLDTGLYLKVNDFKLGKKSDGWSGSIRYKFMIVTHDGNVLKEEEKNFSIEKLKYPDDLTMDYQAAMAASEIFNHVYEDLLNNFITYSSNIESHRSLKEIVRGKGIITIRKADTKKGKARVYLNIRVSILVNDYEKTILLSKDAVAKKVNEIISEINKKNQYRLVVSLRDQTETFFPAKLGKLVYDANNDVYSINYTYTKEFDVSPGKALVVANLFLPKVSETITKGVYIDVNPEKGASLGLNVLVDTKNNFFDIGFIK